MRPSLIAGAILGFAGGLWVVLTCESQCWPVVGNVLAVAFSAGLGAFALYCTVAFFFLGVHAVLQAVAWVYHLIFREEEEP